MAYSNAEPVSSATEPDGESLELFAARLEPANINPTSFLATDYLNHFNEAIMLLELTPDMPDMLSEAKSWEPKDYKSHFMDTEFAAKELACAAYDRAPERFRIPFDLTKRALDRRIASAIGSAEEAISTGQTERLGEIVTASCEAIRELICLAGGIINGQDVRPEQAAGVASAEPVPEVVMAQQDIDALFEPPTADQAPAPQPEASPANDSAKPAESEAPTPTDPSAESEVTMSQAEVDALFD